MKIMSLPTVARFTRITWPSALRLAACLAAVGCGLPAASADIVLALSGTPTALGNGSYAYTYNVTLSGGQIDRVGSTDRDGNVVANQFGTFYDFGPVANNSGGTQYTATGLLSQYFTFSFNDSDASAQLANPYDDPSLLNVRFTYNNPSMGIADPTNTNLAPGSYLVVDGGQVGNLGTFTVDSPYGPALNTGRNYDGQSYKGTNNTLQGNMGFASGPSIPAFVPEPSAWAMLGLGAMGVGMVALRRRQASRS